MKDEYGSAAIAPDVALAGQKGQWEIRYVVGKAGIKEGGGIRIITPGKGLDRWELGKVMAFCDDPDVYLEVITENASPITYHHSNYPAVDVVVYGGDLEEGATIRVVIGALGGLVSGRFVQPRAQTHADAATFQVLVDHQGNGRFSRERMRAGAYHEVPGALTVDVRPARAARIRCTVRPGLGGGRDLIGVLAVEDAYENPISDEAFDVSLCVEEGELEIPVRIVKPEGQEGVTFAAKQVGGETGWVGASCWRSGIYGVSNPVSGDFSMKGHGIYMGDMHVMTGSAGNPHMAGTTESALKYARDVFGLDFSAVTNSGTRAWPDDCELFRNFNKDHEFVTLPAYEHGLKTGHKNVYMRHEDPGAPRARTASELFEALGDRDCMVISHHTNITSETDPERSWGALDISSIDPKYERLIEISQNRGSFETDDVGGEVSFGGYGSSIRDVLARGYRLGFVGGTDSHRGRPGSRLSNQAGLDARVHITGGITGVLCAELTREAVWGALMARRCYATTSVRMLLDFDLNGLSMGEDVRLAEEGENRFAVRTLTVKAAGTYPLDRVVIVRNGQEVHSAGVDGMECCVQWEDGEALDGVRDAQIGGVYYYAKVYQKEGNVGWTSPVWLTF